jgi:hypothetical protein
MGIFLFIVLACRALRAAEHSFHDLLYDMHGAEHLMPWFGCDGRYNARDKLGRMKI